MAGPYCASLLADRGAEVIRIERPGGDNDRRIGYGGDTGDTYSFMARNRNKKGITLSLDKEEGRRILHELVQRSDVLVESISPPSIKKELGVDYDTLSKINPRIIVVSITCFGLTGVYANKIGFDTVAQAMSGVMSFTGFPGNPPLRSPAGWVDFATGVHAALGVMFALWHRQQSGKGQLVDLALLDTASTLMMLHGVYAEYIKRGVERSQVGNYSPYCYSNTFRAKDGWVHINVVRDGVWRRFVKILGRDELADDPRFKTDWDRFENRLQIDGIINGWVAPQSVDEIMRKLGDRVPCCRVNSIAEAVAEPQLASREMLISFEYKGAGEVPVPGSPLKLSDVPAKIERPAPLAGEHTEEILIDLLGYRNEQVRKLKEQKII